MGLQGESQGRGDRRGRVNRRDVTTETESPEMPLLALEMEEGTRVPECWQLLEGGKRQGKNFALNLQEELSAANTLSPGQGYEAHLRLLTPGECKIINWCCFKLLSS